MKSNPLLSSIVELSMQATNPWNYASRVAARGVIELTAKAYVRRQHVITVKGRTTLIDAPINISVDLLKTDDNSTPHLMTVKFKSEVMDDKEKLIERFNEQFGVRITSFDDVSDALEPYQFELEDYYTDCGSAETRRVVTIVENFVNGWVDAERKQAATLIRGGQFDVIKDDAE